MAIALSPEEFQLFRTFIKKECGIIIDRDKSYLIEHRLAPLLQEYGCRSYQDFYFQARHGRDAALRDRIVDALTTSETMWFRDSHPFDAFRDELLPCWADELKSGKRGDIRIWSAACSTGQEPYSIKMTILEYARLERLEMLKDEARVAILATDVSNGSLIRARQGLFYELHMARGLPPSCRDRYFTRVGSAYQIADEVRRGIDFRHHNLQDDFKGFGSFDLVFLRNVAIYFSREFKEKLCARIARSLRPGGSLFLGSAESLTGIRHDFTPVVEGRTVYYRLRT